MDDLLTQYFTPPPQSQTKSTLEAVGGGETDVAAIIMRKAGSLIGRGY